MSGSNSRSCCVTVGLLLALLASSVAGASYRLDGSIVPSHYNLTIGVLRDAAGDAPALFDGEVAITLRLAGSESVTTITLHSDGLNILECRLSDGATGAQVEVIASDRLTYDATTQQVNVPLTQALLPERDYTLTLKYVGSTRTDLAGRFTTKQQNYNLVAFNKASGAKFGTSQATLTAAEQTVDENLKWDTARLGDFRTYLAGRNGSAMVNAFSALSLLLVALVTMLRH